MLAMGNILFLIGITILLGVQRTLLFFARKQKLKGTAAFAGGILLILLRYRYALSPIHFTCHVVQTAGEKCKEYTLTAKISRATDGL